jgi:hypothetical protein
MAHVATVTIDKTQVPSDQTDFVVYVDLSDLPANEFWGTVANGGGDIRCYKSDGTTQLAREVVSCDTATDTGELHVKFSGTLSSSVDTEIQIWTDEGTEPAVTATYGRNAVWSDYEVVAHLDSDGTDSTGNNPSPSSSGTISSYSGKIGGGRLVDGYYQYGSGTYSTSLTMQGWMNRPNNLVTTNEIRVACLGDISATDQQLNLGTNVVGSDSRTDFQFFNGTVADTKTQGTAVFQNTWFMLHGVQASTSDRRQYTNGSQDGINTANLSLSGIDTFRIGQSADLTPYGETGRLDEVRLRYSVLSADWITTEYNNQSAPSTFYTAAAVSTGADVSPFGLQALHRSYQPVAASRLNGVMQ